MYMYVCLLQPNKTALAAVPITVVAMYKAYNKSVKADDALSTGADKFETLYQGTKVPKTLGNVHTYLNKVS